MNDEISPGVYKILQKYRVDLKQLFINKQSVDLEHNGGIKENEALLQEELVNTPNNSPNCTDNSSIDQASSSNGQVFDNSKFMKDFGNKKQASLHSQNSLQENDESIAVEEDYHEPIVVKEDHQEPIAVEEDHHEPIAVEEEHHESIVAKEDHHEPFAVEEEHHEPIAVKEYHHEPIVKELINEMGSMEIRKDSYDLALDFFVPTFTKDFLTTAAISAKMFVVDADLKFFNDYVKMMSAPNSYQIKVTRVFRLEDLNASDCNIDYVKNHTLLMHGVHWENLFDLLRKGFDNSNGASSKRMFFGRGFYFSDCSTKAFNFSSRRGAYGPEREADNGECQPKTGHTGYILMCNVALGCEYSSYNPYKYNDYPFEDGDSIKSMSKYRAKEMLKLHLPRTKDVGMQAVNLPYGGFDCGKVKDFGHPEITNFADYCVFDPKQIEMQWLLEVRRVS